MQKKQKKSSKVHFKNNEETTNDFSIFGDPQHLCSGSHQRAPRKREEMASVPRDSEE